MNRKTREILSNSEMLVLKPQIIEHVINMLIESLAFHAA